MKKRSLCSQNIEQKGVKEAEAAEEMGPALVGYPTSYKGVFCMRVRENSLGTWRMPEIPAVWNGSHELQDGVLSQNLKQGQE